MFLSYWEVRNPNGPHFSSVQFSRSVVSDSLRPHELQHTRPPCPLPTPGAYPNSCPSSWWCHPTISSSVVPFSSCPQSFPASGSFQMSQLFASGGLSIGVSASTSRWFKIRCQQSCIPFTDSRRGSISLSLPASRCYPYSLTCGPFLLLQNQQVLLRLHVSGSSLATSFFYL